MNPDSNDEVARLLSAERDLPQPPPGAAERVLARVHGTIASPPVPPGAALGSPARPGLLAAAATTSVWLKLAAVLVVGAGGVTTYHLATRDAAPASTPEPVATTVAVPPEPLPVPPTAVVAPAPTPTPTPTPSAPTPTTPPTAATQPTVAAAAPLPTPSDPSPTPPLVKVAPEPPARDPAAERKLLEAAQNALARSDGAAALQATKDHAKLFPRGALVEERLSLRVRALVMTGQRPAAEKTADELRRRFPNSIHLPAVEAVLGAQP